MSRERDIDAGLAALRLVARGWPSTKICDALQVSPGTVTQRLRKLYGILGARNAAHAVVIAGVRRLLTAQDLRAAAEDRRSGFVEDVEFWVRPRGVVLDEGRAVERARQQKEA